ncbi:RNA-directed DNA polymerase from mobile element jockey [Trichonephila clavipes]|nr:RNA-directed DNA polymerase from mobile element jockey [Trichonephila clavipes]
MSALESLHFSTEHRHSTVIEILLLLRKLERTGFDVIFSWVPGHVGILGNEQADTAARSMSDHMQRPVCYRDLKTSTQNYIHRVWQETWDQQVLNKLHSIHPSTSHWAALPVRRHDVRLTRLRIGHTRFTHRHLLLGCSREHYVLGKVFLAFSGFTHHCGSHDGSIQVRICPCYNPVYPYMRIVFHQSDGIYQQDIAKCHTSGSVRAWFKEHQDEFTVLPWPANSSYLNAIENLRDYLERVVQIVNPHPHNLEQPAADLDST